MNSQLLGAKKRSIIDPNMNIILQAVLMTSFISFSRIVTILGDYSTFNSLILNTDKFD